MQAMYNILNTYIMAIVKSLGLGKARGSAGEFTYSTIEGRTIARTKPAHVHNPKTDAQQAQRTKMREVVVAWRAAGQRFERLWTNRKKYHSAYNSFVSANIANNGTFEVPEGEEYVYMNDGFILGQGQYSANQLEISPDASTCMLRIKNSDSLFHNLKVGDIVGCVFVGDSGQVSDVLEKVITQDDLASPTGHFVYEFQSEKDDITGYAPYWYSPSRNLSTDCVVVIK